MNNEKINLIYCNCAFFAEGIYIKSIDLEMIRFINQSLTVSGGMVNKDSYN